MLSVQMPRRMCLLVAGLVLLTGCSRSLSHAYTTQTSTTQAPASSDQLAFTAVAFDLHAAAPVASAAVDAARAGVLDTLNRYLDAAVLTPLRSGGPAGDLSPLFTRPAVDRVMAVGPERFAFIDENLPPLTDLHKDAAGAGMTALAGSDGTMSVVTAGLDLRLTGRLAGELVTVVRTGELVLVPEGGAWRIDAYDLKVTRTLPSGTTTTTARS
jgi:uncharacterized protein YceK